MNIKAPTALRACPPRTRSASEPWRPKVRTPPSCATSSAPGPLSWSAGPRCRPAGTWARRCAMPGATRAPQTPRGRSPSPTRSAQAAPSAAPSCCRTSAWPSSATTSGRPTTPPSSAASGHWLSRKAAEAAAFPPPEGTERATSVNEQLPCLQKDLRAGFDFARHCEFPLRALQAQKWDMFTEVARLVPPDSKHLTPREQKPKGRQLGGEANLIESNIIKLRPEANTAGTANRARIRKCGAGLVVHQTCVYIYREREIEREREIDIDIDIVIYIYI